MKCFTNNIQLYRPYGELLLFQILQQERTEYGLLHVIGAGFPAVCAYHVADWASFLCETILDSMWEGEGKNKASPRQLRVKERIQKVWVSLIPLLRSLLMVQTRLWFLLHHAAFPHVCYPPTA